MSALGSFPDPSQAIRENRRALKVGSALWSFPDPSQAIMETWWAPDVCVSPEELLLPLSGYRRYLEVGVSPGELPRPFSGHQGYPEGPRRGCQPWRPSQTPLRPSWRPGRPLKWVSALKSYSCPSQAVRDLEGPGSGCQPRGAFRETWRALDVGVSLGELPRPLSYHQGDLEGPPGFPGGLIGAWIVLQN